MGVKFERQIDVDSWVQRVGHPDQDPVFSATTTVPRSDLASVDLQPSSDTEPLAAISAALDHVCERLAPCANTSVELDEELLRLNGIAQSLRRLSRRTNV